MRRRSLTGRRCRRGILALLAALTCLAGLAVAKLNTSPARPAATLAQAAPPQKRLAAVSWPAYGVAAADIGGFGVVAGPGATRPVPIASVAKVMTAYVILHDHPLPSG